MFRSLEDGSVQSSPDRQNHRDRTEPSRTESKSTKRRKTTTMNHRVVCKSNLPMASPAPKRQIMVVVFVSAASSQQDKKSGQISKPENKTNIKRQRRCMNESGPLNVCPNTQGKQAPLRTLGRAWKCQPRGGASSDNNELVKYTLCLHPSLVVSTPVSLSFRSVRSAA